MISEEKQVEIFHHTWDMFRIMVAKNSPTKIEPHEVDFDDEIIIHFPYTKGNPHELEELLYGDEVTGRIIEARYQFLKYISRNYKMELSGTAVKLDTDSISNPIKTHKTMGEWHKYIYTELLLLMGVK